MAEETAGDRTEAATPRRRSEARDRGQVARSADLTSALVLLAALWMLQSWGPDLMDRLLALQARWLGDLAHPRMDSQTAIRLFADGAAAFALASAPLVLGLMGVGLAVNLFQVGALFTWVPLSPEWGRVDPIAGFGRLFSSAAVMRLVMGVLKLAAIGWVAWHTLDEHLPILGGMLGRPVAATFALTGGVMVILGVRIALVLLLLGILDYAYQRWDFERGLRMSKQEIKEELKRMEGDPQMKARRLQMARQLARQRMMKQVPKADVVITNPTEIAVAIRYDVTTMEAPVVVAKGARLLAQRIREIAVENGVLIVERKPLARALYANVEVGQYVPKEHFDAIVEVLQFVYQLDRTRGARWGLAGAGR